MIFLRLYVRDSFPLKGALCFAVKLAAVTETFPGKDACRGVDPWYDRVSGCA